MNENVEEGRKPRGKMKANLILVNECFGLEKDLSKWNLRLQFEMKSQSDQKKYTFINFTTYR